MTDGPADRDADDLRFEAADTERLADSTRGRVPKQIGQFHVKDVLASGGMGVVYRAIQEQPRRTVAVKVMKHGIASRSAMRRFQYESQVLARLRHPGIAQVFEAGTYDDGSGPVPYFAMEYVPNAKPVTQFAKEKSLGTRELLELFASVCDAVHHGHQKGIVHRDLKPDNILVDSNGDSKIIDFGVARGTDSDLALTTLQTEVGQLIGTLQYMSPEQCEADPSAIDARSDVYALGVVLYELLTGRLPYEIDRRHVLRGTTAIREHVPTRPSTIDRTLRGDIETIVLMALEKDPERRYPSAADLAKDIRSYLNGEAIRARPPSTAYQARLFARRHKATLGTAVTLILIGVVATLLVVRSHERARRAELAAAAALERASQAEQAATSRRSGVSGKQKPTDLVGHAPAEFSLVTLAGDEVGTADFANHKATVLNFVAPDCPFCLKQVPLVERIRAEYEAKGVRLVNVAMRLFHEFTATDAANVFARLGSHIEFTKDETGQVGNSFNVTGYPTLSVVDSSGTVRYAIVGDHSDLTTHLRGQLDALILGMKTPEERLAVAEKLHRQTLENNRRTLGEGHRDTLRSMENLAATLTKESKNDEAEDLYREIWNVRRRLLGENDPQTLGAMHELAVVLLERGKPAEAEALLRQTVALQQRVLGNDDAATRLSLAHLGMALLAQEKTEGAEPYVAELIDLRRKAARARDADSGTLNEYAWLLLTCKPDDLRDPATALGVAEEAVKLTGRQDADKLDTLARAREMTGDLRGAIETQQEALALIPPADFFKALPLRNTLAEYCRKAGDLQTLETWYRDYLDRARASLPEYSLAVGSWMNFLGLLLLEEHRYVEAEPLLRESLESARGGLPGNHWILSGVESSLGESLAGQGRFEEAEPLVVNAYRRLKDNAFVPPAVRRDALRRVVDLYTAWGKPEEASRYGGT